METDYKYRHYKVMRDFYVVWSFEKTKTRNGKP